MLIALLAYFTGRTDGRRQAQRRQTIQPRVMNADELAGARLLVGLIVFCGILVVVCS